MNFEFHTERDIYIDINVASYTKKTNPILECDELKVTSISLNCFYRFLVDLI